jgi:hypothetical protein
VSGGTVSVSPIQLWSGAFYTLLADARRDLDPDTWVVLLDLIAIRTSREITSLWRWDEAA